MWISNAGFASLMIVFARIENDKNITAFLVDYDPSNGIKLGEEENKLGIHSSSTRQVFFNETVVPLENILGERNGGFKIAMNALNVGRVKLGVACLDAQRRITTESIKYANADGLMLSPAVGVKKKGDFALLKYEKRYNKNQTITPSKKQILNSISRLDTKVKNAIDLAYNLAEDYQCDVDLLYDTVMQSSGLTSRIVYTTISPS